MAAASESFETILNQVKKSNLNFRMDLSPFSAVIYIKKSLIKDRSGTCRIPPTPDSVILHQVNSENQDLTQKVGKLERMLESIKSDYEISVVACENAHKTIAALEYDLNKVKSNQVEIKKENDHDDLLLKTETLRDEVEEVKKINISLESCVEDQAKYIHDLEAKNQTLDHLVKKFDTELSAKRSSHKREITEVTKALKKEVKSWKKKLGQERKLKIKLEKKIEHANSAEHESLNNNIVYSTSTSVSSGTSALSTSTTIYTQTDYGPDIPYSITTPLPPIFNSQLLFKTPPIKFLSRSIPNLDKICWSQPDYGNTDEADEALADQYDREVKDFYIEACERARILRLSMGQVIIGNFDTSRDTDSISNIEDSTDEII